MLEYLTLILLCQLAGEIFVTRLQAPLPGPVVGMLLLFLFLLFRGSVPEALGRLSAGLLNHLSLLFVPAGVGVMVHFELLGDDFWPLATALVLSTLVTIAVTALVMAALNRTGSAKPLAGKVRDE
ncbi:MAG: CidA/LrgA family protein [Gammaproteobacteria bacterium]|nr:CidA/LrgA family protein [Gammaproteobacteria bacterium]